MPAVLMRCAPYALRAVTQKCKGVVTRGLSDASLVSATHAVLWQPSASVMSEDTGHLCAEQWTSVTKVEHYPQAGNSVRSRRKGSTFT